jgi:hypothetical protein
MTAADRITTALFFLATIISAIALIRTKFKTLENPSRPKVSYSHLRSLATRPVVTFCIIVIVIPALFVTVWVVPERTSALAVDSRANSQGPPQNLSCGQSFGRSLDDANCVSELQRNIELGNGPWPYIVVNTGDQGLYARSTDDIDSERLGAAANRSIVWVDCVSTSDFTPPVADPSNVGPTWLKIRWPNDRQSSQFFSSEPTNASHAYVYSGFAIPLGHSRQIPACAR